MTTTVSHFDSNDNPVPDNHYHFYINDKDSWSPHMHSAHAAYQSKTSDDDSATPPQPDYWGNKILHEYHFHIRTNSIPKDWILLDSCSTVNIFCNKDLLQNIHKVNKTMKLHCQSGTSSTNLMGTLPGYPEPIWFAPDGIANVLSLARTNKHFRVYYDSSTQNTFTVETNLGPQIF